MRRPSAEASSLQRNHRRGEPLQEAKLNFVSGVATGVLTVAMGLNHLATFEAPFAGKMLLMNKTNGDVLRRLRCLAARARG